MRISDWSSDVCSSDLANIKHRPSGRRPSLYFMLLQILSILLNILWWIIIAQAVMSWLLAFNVINTHNEFVRQLWYVLERITEPLYRPIRRIMPDFGGIDLTPMVVLILLIIIRGPRSEEHTSELQSLMRISYAVFCLKKQNNNKQ